MQPFNGFDNGFPQGGMPMEQQPMEMSFNDPWKPIDPA
jgi:hypothetical protein